MLSPRMSKVYLQAIVFHKEYYLVLIFLLSLPAPVNLITYYSIVTQENQISV